MILPSVLKNVVGPLPPQVIRQALEESELEYKKLFDNAMEGIFQIYPDGRLIKVNPALAGILGYESPQQLLREIRGNEEKIYVNPNDRKRLLKIIKGKGSVSNFESQIYRRDGRIIWISESAIAVRDEKGNVLYYEGFIQDTTEHKLAEEERAQLLIEQAARIEAEQAQEKLTVLATDNARLYQESLLEIERRTQMEKKLRHSEKRFRALIEKSSEAITLVDETSRNIYASPSTSQILGYSPKEFLRFKPFVLIHPEDRKHTEELVKLLIYKPYESSRGYYRLKHKNGSWRWMEFIATNLLVEPSVKAIVVNYHDVTERIKLEQQKDEFLAIASHELKTPITTIKAYCQILQDQLLNKSDLQSASYLSKINLQVGRLTELVKDLLDVTRIEEGKLLFTKEDFNLDTYIFGLIEDLQQTVPSHKLILEGETKTQVFWDKDRISQALSNLVANAVKYSPRADKIIIRLESKKGNILLSVQDFGIGIPKQYKHKVFERFFRGIGEKKETFSGLGLGLYITREIVSRHDGKIWVDTAEGKGSTFCVKLPCKSKK